jgi:lipoate-protein ligase A
LKSILITGDFFAFPKRAIFDLEARLKDARADIENLVQFIERFFTETRPVIPGIEARDFIRAIDEALRKVSYPTHGIPDNEVNSVFTVVEPYEKVSEPNALLLPYCAKILECDVRFTEGCLECGRCAIGEAFALARRHGLKPITIQNYEHLEETLQECVNQGIRGFIGCCCEAFLAKHREDFERIGLPGILVDLDSATCYDLGEEEAAHRGRFDRETSLKLYLLQKVIEGKKNGRASL